MRMLNPSLRRLALALDTSDWPTYLRWSYIAEKCGTPNLPVSEDVGRRLLCPPLHPLLTEEQEMYICASLLETIETVKKEI